MNKLLPYLGFIIIISLLLCVCYYFFSTTQSYERRIASYKHLSDSLQMSTEVLEKRLKTMDSAYFQHVASLHHTLQLINGQRMGNRNKIDSIIHQQDIEMTRFCEEMTRMGEFNLDRCQQ